MAEPSLQTPLLTPLRRWLMIAGLIVVAGLFLLNAALFSSTPTIAAIRAVKEATGSNAGRVKVLGRYEFEDVDRSSSPSVQLVCGAVTADQTRSFAALVRVHRGGRGPRTFAVEELVFEPPKGLEKLPREAQLLGACA